MIKALLEKIKESLLAVVPITVVVLILCCIFPVSGWTIFAFLIGAIMLIFGLSFFNLGADSSMMKLGEQNRTICHQKEKYLDSHRCYCCNWANNYDC